MMAWLLLLIPLRLKNWPRSFRLEPEWSKPLIPPLPAPWLNGEVGGVPLDVFIAGDDDAAKQTWWPTWSRDGGLVGVDVGPLHRARQLEGLALLGITLQFKHNLGFSDRLEIDPQKLISGMKPRSL